MTFRSWFESLSHVEQVCWAFDTVPSSINQVYWSNSFADLKYRLKIRAGETSAQNSQAFETMAKVVSQVFGGGDSKKSNSPSELVQTKDQMLAAFNSVYG